jgi:hypothetical protein
MKNKVLYGLLSRLDTLLELEEEVFFAERPFLIEDAPKEILSDCRRSQLDMEISKTVSVILNELTPPVKLQPILNQSTLLFES